MKDDLFCRKQQTTKKNFSWVFTERVTYMYVCVCGNTALLSHSKLPQGKFLHRDSPKSNTFMHLADAFIQSDLQCIRVIHFLFLSVCQYNSIQMQMGQKKFFFEFRIVFSPLPCLTYSLSTSRNQVLVQS